MELKKGWLMESLREAAERAKHLPKWATDITKAYDRQYRPKEAPKARQFAPYTVVTSAGIEMPVADPKKPDEACIWEYHGYHPLRGHSWRASCGYSASAPLCGCYNCGKLTLFRVYASDSPWGTDRRKPLLVNAHIYGEYYSRSY